MEQKMLDRATYKKIKGMTREEMQNFLTNYYYNVMADAEAPTLDLGEPRKEIGGIKGVGEKCPLPGKIDTKQHTKVE